MNIEPARAGKLLLTSDELIVGKESLEPPVAAPLPVLPAPSPCPPLNGTVITFVFLSFFNEFVSKLFLFGTILSLSTTD